MSFIKFTAVIISKRKGRHLARADELGIAASPATTQRGALRNLKLAVYAELKQAAATGRLADLLNDAGYPGMVILFKDVTATLERFVWNQDTITLRLPRIRKRTRGTKKSR